MEQTSKGWAEASIVVVAWAAMFIGYIMNVAKLFLAASEPVSTFILLRILGVIVWPIGGVLGWF